MRPCALAVTTPGGATLHSIVEAGWRRDGGREITPLSELMVASLAEGDTAAFFTNFDTAAQAKLTPDGVTGAREQMTLALTGILDLSGVDPIQDPLVAASGSSQGNALDQTLDALGTKLALAQVTLADVTAAVVANPGSTAPVMTMLQPAASGCASLKSGTYRALDLHEGDDGDNWKIQVDATALTVAYPDGTSEVLVDQGGCHFTLVSDEPASMYVSKSGVSVVRDGADSVPATPVLVLPEQTIAVSELAGTWNVMSHERGDRASRRSRSRSRLSFDANGNLTGGTECDDFETCVPWANGAATVTVHPDGGFNFTEADGSARIFAFKSADGHPTLYMVGSTASTLRRGRRRRRCRRSPRREAPGTSASTAPARSRPSRPARARRSRSTRLPTATRAIAQRRTAPTPGPSTSRATASASAPPTARPSTAWRRRTARRTR